MRLCLVVVLVLSLFAVRALGDAGGIPHNPHEAAHTVTLGIVNEDGVSGTFDPLSVATFQEGVDDLGHLHFYYEYICPDSAGLPLYANDGTTILGYLDSLIMDAMPDPSLTLNFAVKASPFKASTFSFISAVDVVPSVIDASGYATAAVTLTDNTNLDASVTGGFSGDLYQARYNNGSLFANLVNSFSIALPTRPLTQSEQLPASGYAPIGGTVTQMEAQFLFTLSKGDSASGTSFYEIIGTEVPEPSSILGCCAGLIGLIGFAVRKRR